MSDVQDKVHFKHQSQKKKSYFEAREDTKLTLRKQKLDDRLRFKRQLVKDPINEDGKLLEINPTKLNLSSSLLDIKIDSISTLFSIINKIGQSANIDEVKYSILIIRKYIMEINYQLEELLKGNIVDIIHSLLKSHLNEQSIIYECTWILINLSYKIETPDFVNYLLSNNWFTLWELIIKIDSNPLTINVFWLLSNLSVTAKHLTYLIFERDFFTSLMIPMLMKDKVSKLILEFGFSIITIGIEELIKQKYQNIQPTITKLMCDYHLYSENLTADAIVCLAALSNIQNETIAKEIFTCGIMRRIIRREIETNEMNQEVVFQLLGNIVTYVDDKLIDITVTKELVSYIRDCLSTATKTIVRKNACWCLSNLSCGNHEQVKCILAENILPLLANIIKEDQYISAFEALYCISNILCSGEIEFAFQLNSINIIDLLLDTITKNEKHPDMIGLCLDGLEAMFTTGRRIMNYTNNSNLFLNTFEMKGGKEILTKLTQIPNQKIYDSTVGIIHQFYNSA